MTKETFINNQQLNEIELFWIYVKTEIEREGIEVHRISIDDTVITNKEVPEKIKSRILEHAAYKGINIKFKVKGQEN